eukprot:scaffold60234_cov60-Attheya_sp.AAC.4
MEGARVKERGIARVQEGHDVWTCFEHGIALSTESCIVKGSVGFGRVGFGKKGCGAHGRENVLQGHKACEQRHVFLVRIVGVDGLSWCPWLRNERRQFVQDGVLPKGGEEHVGKSRPLSQKPLQCSLYPRRPLEGQQ